MRELPKNETTFVSLFKGSVLMKKKHLNQNQSNKLDIRMSLTQSSSADEWYFLRGVDLQRCEI